MSLTSEALQRLKKRCDEDRARPWKPGQQLTDAELIWNYIESAQSSISRLNDELFLHSNLAKDAWEREALERGRQGIFG